MPFLPYKHKLPISYISIYRGIDFWQSTRRRTTNIKLPFSNGSIYKGIRFWQKRKVRKFDSWRDCRRALLIITGYLWFFLKTTPITNE
jgi:hypothetical protein